MYNKRVLFDASTVNITIQGGGSLAVTAYLNAILDIYPNNVDVVVPSELNIKDDRFISLNVKKRSKIQRYLGVIQGKLYRSADYIVNYLKRNSEKYNLVFLNNGHFAGYIVKKLRKYDFKFIIFHHNYEPEYAIGSKSILSLYGRTGIFVKKWERKAYINAELNLFITPEDKDIFEREYGQRNNNFVIGMFEPYATSIEKPKEKFDNSVAITCSLSAKQNLLSLRRFKDRYLRIFHSVLPSWDLKLMGRNPSEEIINWGKQYSYVEIFPNPENIGDLSSLSSIYLCQMDAGGGLKLRIMDGLRNGQPILTHKVSARGYNEFFGTPFFKIYNDEETFKRGLNELISYIQSDNFSRESIQKMYYDKFAYGVGLKRLRNIIDKTL